MRGQAVELLDASASTLGLRVVIVAGAGKNFCAGIDLQFLRDMFKTLGQVSCPGRMRELFRRNIMTMQVDSGYIASSLSPPILSLLLSIRKPP